VSTPSDVAQLSAPHDRWWASDFNDRIRYAVETIPGVELKRYEISFTFANA